MFLVASITLVQPVRQEGCLLINQSNKSITFLKGKKNKVLAPKKILKIAKKWFVNIPVFKDFS